MSNDYYSATEYRLKGEQIDDVRVAAYHQNSFPLAVIWFSSLEHANIRDSIAHPFERNATIGLGSLDRLPLELLQESFMHLDMRSLLTVRQVNLSARRAVDSLNQYQAITAHGLNLLCALLRTQLAAKISLIDLYNALCTKNCSLCHEFGGFMSLVTWTRCCITCLQNAPELQVQTLAAVKRELQLTKIEKMKLWTMKTLPGEYSWEGIEYKTKIEVVSLHRAISICQWRVDDASTQSLKWPSTRRHQNLTFMASCALPYYNKTTRQIEYGMSCAGCQLAFEKEIMGQICEQWLYDARDKMYARDDFVEHFRWCKQAQLLWESSNEGSKQS